MTGHVKRSPQNKKGSSFSFESLLYGMNVVMVKHTYFESRGLPEYELLEILKTWASYTLLISLPFKDSLTRVPLDRVILGFGKGGSSDLDIKATKAGSGVLRYLLDAVVIIYYHYKSKKNFHLYIGVDNFNAVVGVILRWLGRVDRVVYHTIDFAPNRFKSSIMNSAYMLIEKAACYHSDFIWNISELMTEAREERGIQAGNSGKIQWVPQGCRFSDITRYPVEEVHRKRIVYMGSLQKEHGVHLIVEAMPDICMKVPEAELLVVGGGKLLEPLKERAIELGMEERITFTGYVESNMEVFEYLARSAFGAAPYPQDEGSYKKFSDPGKVKNYLACALPVVITDVPRVAHEIDRKKAGILIGFEQADLVDASVRLLTDDDLLSELKHNAAEMAREYEYSTIFFKTLKEVFESNI